MAKMSEYTLKLSDTFNACPINFKKTCEELTLEHRTIQQNITRFCVTWLTTLATDWTLTTDTRNEASVAIAKDLWRIEEAKEILERPIPYI